ncbi:MAG TPA: hypothetical protein VE360_05560, partial [Pyrinomonadaceae bacterium]|nr:hypothetical protein [Pyrinomonadaceae bacterium]
MRKKVKTTLASLCAPCAVLLALFAGGGGRAQDAREALGPKDAAGDAAWERAPHPLKPLMATAHSKLRTGLKGKHPRV